MTTHALEDFDRSFLGNVGSAAATAPGALAVAAHEGQRVGFVHLAFCQVGVRAQPTVRVVSAVEKPLSVPFATLEADSRVGGEFVPQRRVGFEPIFSGDGQVAQAIDAPLVVVGDGPGDPLFLHPVSAPTDEKATDTG